VIIRHSRALPAGRQLDFLLCSGIQTLTFGTKSIGNYLHGKIVSASDLHVDALP